MSAVARFGRTLVLAPHPDDEVLGCGGTIARIADAGGEVHVGVVTRGEPPQFSETQVAQVRAEAERAHARLGVARAHFLDLPAARLDRLPRAELNAVIEGLVSEVRPETLFVPFVGDLHFDHRLVFDAAMVASRPRGQGGPMRVLAYETMSETNWSAPHLGPPFAPNVFIDISDQLEAKLEAFACFASQCRPFPDERSTEALNALARLRGATVHCRAAEAYFLVRELG